ncbi:MAG: hypothetical protein AB7N76_12600 [Planctomycetota bacterium]
MVMRVVAIPAVGAVPARKTAERVSSRTIWLPGQAPKVTVMSFFERDVLPAAHQAHLVSWSVSFLLPVGTEPELVRDSLLEIESLSVAELQVGPPDCSLYAPLGAIPSARQVPALRDRGLDLTSAGRPLPALAHDSLAARVWVAQAGEMPQLHQSAAVQFDLHGPVYTGITG